MSTKRTIALHPDKIWEQFILPFYGAEIKHYLLLEIPDYEGLADTVNKDFHLTPEQWEAVLQNWEQYAYLTENYN